METIILIILTVAVLSWKFKPTKGVNTISTDELKKILNDKDKFFVDVRTAPEYKGRNIKQFKNIPLGSDFSKIPKDKEVVVICQSGMRSASACKQLKKLGYTKITNVRGGMNNY